jgi:DNA-binding MarR family transcriptional regulator
VMHAMREGSALGILYSATVAHRLGISSSDLECLDFVATNEPVTAGDLARATGLTTGAITGVIDRLAKAGFVQRLQGEDKRKVFVGTTAAFARKVVPLFEPMQRLQTAVIDKFTKEQLQQIASFMSSSLEAARMAVTEVGNRKKSQGPR